MMIFMQKNQLLLKLISLFLFVGFFQIPFQFGFDWEKLGDKMTSPVVNFTNPLVLNTNTIQIHQRKCAQLYQLLKPNPFYSFFAGLVFSIWTSLSLHSEASRTMKVVFSELPVTQYSSFVPFCQLCRVATSRLRMRLLHSTAFWKYLGCFP